MKPFSRERVASRDMRIVRDVARRHFVDRNRVDDLVQDVWLALLHSSVNSPPSPALLSTLARRLAVDGYRSQLLRRTEVLPETAGASSVDDDLVAREARALLHAAVAELRTPYREVIELRFLEELPPRTIALRLGVSVETVNTRIKRGLTLLRQRLQGRSDHWSLLALLRSWLRGLATRPVHLAAAVPLLCAALVFLRWASAGEARLDPFRGTSATPARAVALDASVARREPVQVPPVPGSGSRAPMRQARGLVQDPDGAAVPFARVRAWSTWEESSSAAPTLVETVCAPDGSFDLGGLPADFVLGADEGTRVSNEVLVAGPAAADLQGLRFVLLPAHATSGVVRDAERGRVQLVVDAGAAPVRPGEVEGTHYRQRSARATVGPNGRFELPPLPAGPAVLAADVEGFAASWLPLVLPAAELELDLPRGDDLDVLVTAASGIPPSGWTVRCLQPRPANAPLLGKEWLGVEDTATTDAAGRCHFGARRSGAPAIVSVEHDGRVLDAGWVDDLRSPGRLHLRIGTEQSASGILRDALGRPLAAVPIVLLPACIPDDASARGFPTTPGAWVLDRAETDASGRFRVTTQASGPLVLDVTPVDGQLTLRRVLQSLPVEVEIVLPPSTSVSHRVHVHARSDGRPVVDYKLAHIDARGTRARDVHDARGSARVDLVPEEPVHIVILAEGFAPVVLAPGDLEPGEIDVALDSTRPREIQVLGSSGRPLEACWVRASTADGRICLLSAGNGQSRTALRPGLDGSLRLEALPETLLCFEVWTPNRAAPHRIDVDPRSLPPGAPLVLACDEPDVRPGSVQLRLWRNGGAAGTREPWTGALEIRLRAPGGALVFEARGRLGPDGFEREPPPPVGVLKRAGSLAVWFTRASDRCWSDEPTLLARLPDVLGGTIELCIPGAPVEWVPLDRTEIDLVLP
jgi:RNA polymerase sigma-70 factor (ECF subfamily)